MSTTLCPICKKPESEKFKPFCSARCAQVDLGRWLTESYSVPVNPQNEDAESEEIGSKPSESQE